METEPISRFFDREVASCCAHDGVPAPSSLSPVTRTLLDQLVSGDVRGRSVLELGAGGGALSLALLRAGADRATGFDLSPASVEVARARARAEGASERATFRVGDGAAEALPEADVVVLDKVFCCYPDAGALRDRSIAAARSVYAMALPRSSGFAGVVARVAVWAENLWRRVRRDRFRAFVHDVTAIEDELRTHGFERVVAASRRLVWHVAVYVRADRSAGTG